MLPEGLKAGPRTRTRRCMWVVELGPLRAQLGCLGALGPTCAAEVATGAWCHQSLCAHPPRGRSCLRAPPLPPPPLWVGMATCPCTHLAPGSSGGGLALVVVGTDAPCEMSCVSTLNVSLMSLTVTGNRAGGSPTRQADCLCPQPPESEHAIHFPPSWWGGCCSLGCNHVASRGAMLPAAV